MEIGDPILSCIEEFSSELQFISTYIRQMNYMRISVPKLERMVPNLIASSITHNLCGIF